MQDVGWGSKCGGWGMSLDVGASRELVRLVRWVGRWINAIVGKKPWFSSYHGSSYGDESK